MSEPSLKYCTKRDGYDNNWDGVSDAPCIDLECRFSDGQKFAAVRIDAEFPVLADKIANFLNAGTSDNKRLDEILSDALAGSPETHVAILAREVVRLREAPAVGVPGLTEEALSLACGCALEPVMGQDAIKYGLRTAKREGYRKGWEDASRQARAIPADRVLGEGIVQISKADRREFALLRQHFQLWEKENADDMKVADRAFNARQEVDELIRQHLRANQGGADHA